jgi:hypothetical protein
MQFANERFIADYCIFSETAHRYYHYIIGGIRHRARSCFLHLSTSSLSSYESRIILKLNTQEITVDMPWLVLQ